MPCTQRSCPPTAGDWARAGCLDPSDPIRDPALQPFLSSLSSQKEAAILRKRVPLQVQSGAGRDRTEATSSSLVPVNNKADCLEGRRVISRPLQAPILLSSKGELQSTSYHGTFTVQKKERTRTAQSNQALAASPVGHCAKGSRSAGEPALEELRVHVWKMAL